jgi:hypothetical protein
LPSSAPIGSFHPTRFCPCWAHWGGPPVRAEAPASASGSGTRGRPARSRGTAPPSRCQGDYLS